MQLSMLAGLKEVGELPITTAEPNEHGVYSDRIGKATTFEIENKYRLVIRVARIGESEFIGAIDSKYFTGSRSGSVSPLSRQDWGRYFMWRSGKKLNENGAPVYWGGFDPEFTGDGLFTNYRDCLNYFLIRAYDIAQEVIARSNSCASDCQVAAARKVSEWVMHEIDISGRL